MKHPINPNIDIPSPVGTPIISPRLACTNDSSVSSSSASVSLDDGDGDTRGKSGR